MHLPSLLLHSAVRYETTRKLLRRKGLLDVSTKAFRNCYGSVAAAKRKVQDDPTVHIKLDENIRLRKNYKSLSMRKLTSLFEASRHEYFSTLGAVCLENQHTGQGEPAGPSMPSFRFSEREALARLLFPPPTPTPASYQQQIEDSCEIVRLYASLCGRREYPRTWRQLRRDDEAQSESVDSEDDTDVKPCFLRYRARHISHAVSWNPNVCSA